MMKTICDFRAEREVTYAKPSRRILRPIAFIVLALTVPLHAETRAVRVGVFPAAPLVIEKDGKPGGLFVDLFDYFSAKAGWKVRYVAGTWRESLSRLENGEIDILPAVSYTPERALEFDFSKNPVFIDSGVLFASPKFALHTIFDLQGKQIAALRGSVFTTDFISYTASFGVSCNILYTEDNEAVMRAITRGDAVAGVCIYSLGNELAKKYAVAITPISFSPMALEFAVAKGKNADLIAGIDGLMAPMVGDPNSFYSRSYREWTLPSSATSIPIWIAWGLVGLIALGFFLIAWTFVLRRAVKQRTGELAKNEHKYRTLTESLPQMIFMKDPDSVYVSCNGHYAASLGIEPEDIVGKDDYAFYPRELAESYREGDRSVIKSGASATVVERWLRSGGETWVNTVKAPIWDEGGKIAGVIGIFWDVSDRIRLEKDRERSLREKEILLQEVNHRVKNNLQLISAMLRLEADESAGPEVENFVKATMSRITSIAVIHEMLYIKDDVAEIAIADYLREIGQNLAGMYSMPGRAVGIEIEAGDLRLDLNRMVPLGLITNEMMTNSLKYAFPGRESGTIAIAMSVDEASGQYVYGFMDDGIGLPASFDEAPAKRLGLTFIHSLALQLGGSITMKSGRGLEYELRFPVAGR